ncbi:ribokinase [Acidiphilium sp. AL]|uniref:Ribokinase n=1 Tax=Acidiphilium iwatense TaxID=768198 RepID=A0ABS9DV90_9PROT|nr:MULTISPECIES: ribokinase [Acidiphilium]MCF3946614.1 ribokinase [Acidiphilium iwatense]MCU4159939.1 ribokinase [Acidiphilium sp. AL]
MIVAGSANMDIVVRTSRAPDAGETIIGRDYALYPGGKGANQAVAARRAGAEVGFAGCIGDDAYGDQLVAALVAERIDLGTTRRVAAPTGVAFVIVEAGGQNRIIVVPGANHGFAPADLVGDVPSGSVLLMQLEIPVETVLAAAMRVRAVGGVVILNVSPIAGLDAGTRARLLAVADIVLVNETEAAELLGIAVSEGNSSDAARRLAEGRRGAVITLGAAGAVWCAGGEQGRVPGHRIDVVDTTACGDAFAGAFAAAIERGVSVGEAVADGNAAGALAATISGAQPSLPRRDAIEALRSATG